MEENAIKRISSSDESTVNGILTLAFATCPSLRWMYPEPKRYLEYFSRFVHYYCGDVYAHRCGAYCPDDLKGALLWVTPEVHRDDDQMMTFLFNTVIESRRTEVVELFEKLDFYHPRQPYWYFAFLGVDPAYQKQGVGYALWEYGTELCNRMQSCAYCEATTERSARLYEQLGWKILGTVQTKTSPPFFPMIYTPE